MNPPPPSGSDYAERAKQLRRHLTPLYRFAQMLTSDAAEASACVEETYRRALHERRGDQLARAHLFRLLLTTCADDEEQGNDASAAALAPLHRRLSEAHLRRALPSAFTALRDEHQLLLLLVTTERFSPADAGRVLNLTPEQARAAHQHAYDALRERLLRSASSDERALLESHLTKEALNDALSELLSAQSAGLPAKLNQNVAELMASAPSSDPSPDHAPASTASSSSSSTASRRTSRLLTALLLIVVVGSLSLLAVRFLQSDGEREPRDLVAYSAQQAPSVEAVVHTHDPRQAERFIRREAGRRLTVPAIDSARLSGVGLRVLGETRVPVLLYDDQPSGGLLPVYVYTYAVLDRLHDQFDFSEEALARIQREGGVAAQQAQGSGVLIWRDRDDIFLAVTSGKAEDLRRRLGKKQ